jgi:hypothetical protein
MDLYDRNYKILTYEEIKEIETINQSCKKQYGKFQITDSKIYSEYPKAYRFYNSLFPNNYLSNLDLRDTDKLNEQLNEFKKILTSEREILSFIRDNKAYFIIGSLFKYFPFGHHAAYLFPEFQLGTSYQADYLLVGKSSGGHFFVFVEFESPTGDITLSDGNFGQVFRKGISQVKDWERWLEANFGSLKETFTKYKNDSESLPDEFYSYDRSRIYYIVIAGRRSNFKGKTYREKEFGKRESLIILHYDHLLESSQEIINSPTY